MNFRVRQRPVLLTRTRPSPTPRAVTPARVLTARTGNQRKPRRQLRTRQEGRGSGHQASHQVTPCGDTQRLVPCMFAGIRTATNSHAVDPQRVSGWLKLGPHSQCHIARFVLAPRTWKAAGWCRFQGLLQVAGQQAKRITACPHPNSPQDVPYTILAPQTTFHVFVIYGVSMFYKKLDY